MDVLLLDYGMGNLRSVQRALEAAGARVHRAERLGAHTGRVVLPGVGAFAQACARLRTSGAWDDVAAHLAAERPLLGICLGMQLLFESSEEHGHSAGFGAFPGHVAHLSTQGAPTVPNMGWHRLDDGSWAYFAHSFGVPVPDGAAWVRSRVTHGGRWVAAAERGPIHALQFHPEKSGAGGIARLKEWLVC